MRTSEIQTAGLTGVAELHEQSSGRVFAYCYARVGSRNVAEWAVNATFDRARAALANGGIPEPQLDWLLRTADKFCAPKLCLDARPLESMVVLQDWQGRSFDEIANELEMRYVRLEEERSRLTPWRRVLGAFNFGPALSWIKGLVGALGAAKATVAVVAVVGAIAVVGTPLGTKLHDVVRSDPTPPAPAATPQGSGGGSKTRGGTATPVSVNRSGAGGPQATPKNVGAADMPKGGGRGHGAAASGAGAGAAKPTHEVAGGSNHAAGSPQPHAGSATTSGVSASSSVTTTPKTPDLTNTPAVPAVSVPSVVPTTPGTSVPQTPSTPTPPQTPTAPTAPTLPTVSVPTVDTSTTPTVDTSTVPSVDSPTPPSAPAPPTPPSVPNPPAVTVPSAPPVSPPTVTLPK